MSVVEAEQEYIRFLEQSQRTSALLSKVCFGMAALVAVNLVAMVLIGSSPAFWVLPLIGIGMIIYAFTWLHCDKATDRRLRQNIADAVWDQE